MEGTTNEISSAEPSLNNELSTNILTSINQENTAVSTPDTAAQDSGTTAPPSATATERSSSATDPETSLATLEPYTTPRSSDSRDRGGRRPNRQRRKLHETYQTNFSIFDNVVPDEFIKFFTISSADGQNLAETDTILANRQIELALKGKPKKIIETRAGHLSIEVCNKAQSDAIIKINKLNDITVTVTSDDRMNQTKGTIRYYNKPGYSTERIKKELEIFKVTDIYQMESKKDGKTEKLPTYILTFNTCNLPNEVSIGWTKCPVRLYIPRPRRCFKCQAFGHGATNCRSKTGGICQNCAKPQHDAPCRNETKCSNCDEPHPASSRECFYYKFEQEILATQAKDHLSYPEAKRLVSTRYARPMTSYANVASGRNTSAAVIPKRPILQPNRTHQFKRPNQPQQNQRSNKSRSPHKANDATASTSASPIKQQEVTSPRNNNSQPMTTPTNDKSRRSQDHKSIESSKTRDQSRSLSRERAPKKQRCTSGSTVQPTAPFEVNMDDFPMPTSMPPSLPSTPLPSGMKLPLPPSPLPSPQPLTRIPVVSLTTGYEKPKDGTLNKHNRDLSLKPPNSKSSTSYKS